MERVNTQGFFDNLDVIQLTQWFSQEMQIFKNLILPTLLLEPTICTYTHFMTLEGEQKIYMSADVIYQNHGRCVSRNIKGVRTYTDELEMHFYMGLIEYENTLDPNPVLFNGVGTREDATGHLLNLYVVAHHAIFEPYLN
jgi:hypothetical protein